MKLIKFINAHPDHQGDVLYINPEHVVAVYEMARTRGGSLSTMIYASTSIEWTVEESLNEAITKLQNNLLIE